MELYDTHFWNSIEAIGKISGFVGFVSDLNKNKIWKQLCNYETKINLRNN